MTRSSPCTTLKPGMNVKPRILIVEDDALIRRDLCDVFGAPPGEYCDKYGVAGFEVESAITEDEATTKLARAMDEFRPYDVLLLDLGLPHSNPNGPAEMAVGLTILEAALKDKPSACA